MAHGTKDYGNVSPKEVTYRLDDMAELAIRLGAVGSIDRLGDVIYLDDFSNGVGVWEILTDGTGGSVAINGTIFKYGGYCLKFVGGSTSNRYAQAALSVTFPYPSIMGFEHTISFDVDVESIYFTHSFYNKTGWYLGWIKLDVTNNKLSVYDGSAVWYDVATSLNLEVDTYLFHVLKMVTDLVTGKYVRLIFDGNVYDISQYDLFGGVGSYNPRLNFAIKVVSVSGGNGSAYLDNVIVTRNEP